jgi:glycine hydroxymethyltransferase
MADIAHPSGLIAAGVHPSPMPYCDVVTSTTHKTLRGPRGGIIMMGRDFDNPWGKVAPKSGRVKRVSELIDSTVMPGIQGGPLMHIIAAKAVAFGEALKPEFKRYAKEIIENAKTMADEFLELDYELVSGGTDTHVLLIDLTKKRITGKNAELALGKAGITVNKNMVPFDTKSPFVTSGIRVGTPAITTRGMGASEMRQIVHWIDQVIKDPDNGKILSGIYSNVNNLCSNFPIYEH